MVLLGLAQGLSFVPMVVLSLTGADVVVSEETMLRRATLSRER